MGKYRKKPVVIEAMQFETNNESDDRNMNAVCIWANQGRSPDGCYCWHNGTNIFVWTLEGTMRADVKDWIIRGVKGELYPCKNDVFEATYEPAE
jgi:hypothetical protein